MNSVREFVTRLSRLVEHANSKPQMLNTYFRIVVPEAGQFSLEDTLVRTVPRVPTEVIEQPGALRQAVQILYWIEAADSSEQAFSANDLGVDLAAILALATGRRVKFANEISLSYEGEDWIAFVGVGPRVDGEIYGPVEPMYHTRFVSVVRAVVGLAEQQSRALVSAVRMRNTACCLIEEDHSSAYGLLIAALETLSQGFGSPPTTWSEWDQAERWDQLFQELKLSVEQSQGLRDRLIAERHIRLKRTAIEYAVANLTSDFWDIPYFSYPPSLVISPEGLAQTGVEQGIPTPMAVLVPTDPPELRRRLGLSYDKRSEVFHTSARLNQVVLMALPRAKKDPLPFAGLRRIIDFLLWTEIRKALDSAPSLPDFKVVKPPSDQPLVQIEHE